MEDCAIQEGENDKKRVLGEGGGATSSLPRICEKNESKDEDGLKAHKEKIGDMKPKPKSRKVSFWLPKETQRERGDNDLNRAFSHTVFTNRIKITHMYSLSPEIH